MSGGARPAPKVPLAIEVWRSYAAEIEADLLKIGTDIADWHQGRMSSRRLLVLLEHGLPDESAFKTALRGGRQSRGQRVLEEQLNEQMRLRAAYEFIASRGEVEWNAADYAWVDPVDAVELEKQRAVEEAERERAQDDFESSIGFS